MTKLYTAIFAIFLSSIACAEQTWQALVLSDVHIQAHHDSKTRFYRSDTGRQHLWPQTVHYAKHLAQQEHIKFALLLGDLPAHHSNATDILHASRVAFKGMRKITHRLQTPWFYLVGNNDSPRGDYHSFTHLNKQSGQYANILTVNGMSIPGGHVAATCSANKPCIINRDSVKNIPYFFGNYSAYPLRSHHMRLIVLNSVIFLSPSRWPWGAHYRSDDGFSQQQAIQHTLSWFAKQLADAHRHHESVLLAVHIPPGMNSMEHRAFWLPRPSRVILSLLKRYHQNIVAMLNGHTHFNAIRELRLSSDNHTDVLAITAPGITPLHQNNPGLDVLSFRQHNQHITLYDVTVHAYRPGTQRWYRMQSMRNTFTNDCAHASLRACLDSIPRQQFLSVMQRYYLLRTGDNAIPREGWKAVNAASIIHMPKE